MRKGASLGLLLVFLLLGRVHDAQARILGITDSDFISKDCPNSLANLWLIAYSTDITTATFNLNPSGYSYMPTRGWGYYWGSSYCDFQYVPAGSGGDLRFQYLYTLDPISNELFWYRGTPPAGTSSICFFAAASKYWGDEQWYSCVQELFTCPTCPQGSYSYQCGGRRDPNLANACRACTNPLPPNSIYVSPIAGVTNECTSLTCRSGTVAVSPTGIVDSGSPMGSCQPCTTPLPPNAYYVGTDNGGSNNYCTWACNAGFYTTGSGCQACRPAPAGGTPSTPFGGGLSTECVSTCPAGTFLDSFAWSCTACPNGFYRPQPFTVAFVLSANVCASRCVDDMLATTWQTATLPTPLNCRVGTYATTDPITCYLVSCLACAGAPPVGSYWALDDTTKLSADPTTNQCYTKPCAYATTPPGQQLLGCGGTSAGTLGPCPSPTAGTYFDSRGGGCDKTSPCTPCTSAAHYNPSCPVVDTGKLPLVAGSCDQPCLPTTIDNGQYAAVSTRSAGVPILSPYACPFTCNAGYYVASTAPATCSKCPTSADCPLAGYYIQDCQLSRACVPCGNSAPSTGHYRWLMSKAAYTEPASCQWTCLQGYYLSAGCVPCTRPAACGVGQYLAAPCLAGEGGISAPACASCILTSANAVATGAGADNNPSSCPFACKPGFFLLLGATCVPCTPTGTCVLSSGVYWGGCTALADNSCIGCPNPPAAMNAYVQWNATVPCTWTCTARAFLSGGTCGPCAPGTAKLGAGAGPCTPCSSTQYLKAWGGDACVDVPSNAVRYADGSGYDCAQGFRADLLTPCVPCVTGASTLLGVLQALHLASAAWAPSTCTLTAFTCLSGYYRSLTPAAACLPCTSITGVIPSTATPSQTAAAVVAVCGAYPQCASPNDEITLGCPLSGCAPGYYARYQSPDALALVPAVVCILCAQPPCPAGQMALPCQNGQTSATCGACSPLSVGQVFSGSSGCAIACSAGFNAYAGSLCMACSAGYYTAATNTALACTACAHGTYAAGAGSTGCIFCGAGQYAPDTVAGVGGASVCLPCPAGSYSGVGGVSVCTTCPAGQYAAAAAATACTACTPDTPLSNTMACSAPVTQADCAAAGGFAFVAGACVGCPAGTYCPAGSTAMTHCPVSAAPAPRLSAAVGACSASAWAPARGSGIPTPCPANTSTYSKTGAADIAWCYAGVGFYGLPGTPASVCPYDSYCPTPSIAPLPCAAGRYTNRLGATAAADCSATVMLPPCRAGFYLPFLGTVCAQCPPACYCSGVGSLLSACPDTSYLGSWFTSAGASSAGACTTAVANGNQVKTCGSSGTTFNPASGWVTTWAQCRAKAGFYYVPDLTDSLVGLMCPPGYYCPPQALQPVPCVAATSCPWLGQQINPTPCAVGGLSAPAQFLTCASAPPSNGGSYAAPGNCTTCCLAGMIPVLLSGGLTCQQHPDSLGCAAGYYRPPIPTCAQAFVDCVACPPPSSVLPGGVSVASAAGFSADASCRYACPVGSCFSLMMGTCAPAPAGSYSNASRGCVQCPVGQYMPLSGATACRACPPASSTPSAGGAVFCACAAGSMLSVSTDGSWTMNCSVCPPGTYTSGSSATSCDACAAGTVWVAPWRVETCLPPNKYRPTPASSCQPCPPGTLTNASEQSVCFALPSAASSSSAANNNNNITTSVCAAQTAYSVANSNGTACVCMQGTYGDGYTSCTPCAVPSQCVCPADTYYSVAAAGCRACRAACPPFATLRNRCLAGSTSDTTTCACPADHYFHVGRGDCYPCSECSPFATRTQACAVGATRDATVCVCNAGYVGSGFACACAALTYQLANGTCAACASCSANATRLAYCASGSTADTTQCGPCLGGSSGNGFTCR